MSKVSRPKGYPKLKNYKPSQFMLPTFHSDKKKQTEQLHLLRIYVT